MGWKRLDNGGCEQAGGIAWDDDPVHCAVDNRGGYINTLCGLDLNNKGSWASPGLFMTHHNKCLHCADHPELALHLLGDLP